jgi:hypothetical protein
MVACRDKPPEKDPLNKTVTISVVMNWWQWAASKLVFGGKRLCFAESFSGYTSFAT